MKAMGNITPIMDHYPTINSSNNLASIGGIRIIWQLQYLSIFGKPISIKVRVTLNNSNLN